MPAESCPRPGPRGLTGVGFLASPCVPSPVSAIRTPKLPLLPVWEKGVGGMRGKGAREYRTLLISPKNSTLARKGVGGMRGKSAPACASGAPAGGNARTPRGGSAWERAPPARGEAGTLAHPGDGSAWERAPPARLRAGTLAHPGDGSAWKRAPPARLRARTPAPHGVGVPGSARLRRAERRERPCIQGFRSTDRQSML